MSMDTPTPDDLYLTVDRKKRQPQNDGYLAAISLGHPRAGDKHMTILAVDVVPSYRHAKVWFKRMKTEQPWQTRQ